MERHILVTIDGNASALNAVRFVARFFAPAQDVRFTFFNTAPRPASTSGASSHYDSLERLRCHTEELERQTQKTLDQAKTILIDRGFHPSRLETRWVLRKESATLDIMRECENGLYDSVVMGRRGITWLDEIFAMESSVSKTLFQNYRSAPVWVCRNCSTGRSGVLVCVDGSPAALQAADHVGFILGDDSPHSMTLLCVVPPNQPFTKSPEEILTEAFAAATANNYPPDSVRTKIIQAKHPAKAIIKEAAEGQFAACAVGRSGRKEDFLSRILLGSASHYLFEHLENTSLWLC